MFRCTIMQILLLDGLFLHYSINCQDNKNPESFLSDFRGSGQTMSCKDIDYIPTHQIIL